MQAIGITHIQNQKFGLVGEKREENDMVNIALIFKLLYRKREKKGKKNGNLENIVVETL